METIKKTRELVLAQPNSNAHTRVGKINSHLRRQVLESSSTRSNSEDDGGSGKSSSGSLDASRSGSKEQSQRSARTTDTTFTNKKRSRSDWEQTSASTETAHRGLVSLIDAATAMVSKDASDTSSDEHASDDLSTSSIIDACLHRAISPFLELSPYEALKMQVSGVFAMRNVVPRGLSNSSNPGSAREFPQGIHRPTPKRFDPSATFSVIAELVHGTDASTARRALVANASR